MLKSESNRLLQRPTKLDKIRQERMYEAAWEGSRGPPIAGAFVVRLPSSPPRKPPGRAVETIWDQASWCVIVQTPTDNSTSKGNMSEVAQGHSYEDNIYTLLESGEHSAYISPKHQSYRH